MVHLDTSALVEALTGPRRAAPALRGLLRAGQRVNIATLVLYEWLRGPREEAELAAQSVLFPVHAAAAFDAGAAARAATLYRAVRAPRGRDVDIAIAACALEAGARLWTMNADDFKDIPGLLLYQPEPQR
jgi:predicted nucleic acid-binding protein